jgi:hypothetical protein
VHTWCSIQLLLIVAAWRLDTQFRSLLNLVTYLSPTSQATGILDLVSSIGAEATETADPDLDVVKAAVMLLGDMCSCMPVSCCGTLGSPAPEALSSA